MNETQTLKKRILDDKDARKKLFQAVAGEEEVKITLGDKTYRAERLEILDRPMDREYDEQ